MIIENLVLNSTSRAHLETYLSEPSHAMLLSGAVGVGLGTIAKTLAKQIAGAEVITINPTIHNKQKTASINIDDIRNINTLIGHRRTNKLVIVIDDLESMTNDAPQAFLKLLEEPSSNVYYILTTHNLNKVPATILSRTQVISVLPASQSDCRVLFEQSPLRLTDDKLKKISFMANGHPAEIVRLVTDETHFRNRVDSIEKAKLFLTGSPIERLEIIAGITNRDLATELAYNLAKLTTLTAGQAQNINWLPSRLEAISSALDNLKQNGNTRTQLLFLALNI